MFEKIKTVITFIKQFRDTRALGLLAFAFVAVLVTWSGVKAVQDNYELQKQISELQQKTQIQKLENDNLNLRNKYYETDQFLELAARRQLGKGASGEREFLVPKKVALNYTANIPEPKKVSQEEAVAKRPGYQRNFQAWIDFFLHRKALD